jgi:hypothetical protein
VGQNKRDALRMHIIYRNNRIHKLRLEIEKGWFGIIDKRAILDFIEPRYV